MTSTVFVQASVSLDGFAAGPDVGVEHPLGRDGDRLHDWMFGEDPDPVDAEWLRTRRDRTGAVVIGWRTFDLGLKYWQDVPFPVPCFVVCREPRQDLPQQGGTFHFVPDPATAVERARAAAGDRDVLVLGPSLGRAVLAAGLADEINIDVVPILLGAGTRLLDGHPGDLRQVEVAPSATVTHVRYALGS